MVLSNRAYRLAGALVWGVVALLALRGYFDARLYTPGVTDRSPGWMTVAASLVLTIRASRLGVAVRDDRVTVRSWLRTRHFDRDRVIGARAVPYTGALSPRRPSRQLSMLQLRLADGEYDIPAVLARTGSGRIAALAAQLAATVTP
jgi:hypothetical protein